MKKIIHYFIVYPILSNLIIFGFIMFGTIALFNLKSSYFPLPESRFITVQLEYPGASPKEVEEGIVLKIEDQLCGISSIERYSSVSSENNATISIEVRKDYSVSRALADVKNAIFCISSFPQDMEPPAIFINENMNTVITFAISGENISLYSLRESARKIEAELRLMDGLSKIKLIGYPDEEIEIAIDETLLRTYNITIEDVAKAIQRANIDISGGKITTSTEEYMIRARFKKYYGHQLENIIIKSDINGKTIRVFDVAVVTNQWSKNSVWIHLDSNPCIEIEVQTSRDEDFIAAAETVKTYINHYNQNEEGSKLTILNNSSLNLLERLKILMKDGLIGLLLVMIFLSLFLRPHIAFWLAAGIPLSFLGMIMLAKIFGISINAISLLGLIVTIGIIADIGILVAENIFTELEKGKKPYRAALDGTMQVMPSFLSSISISVLAFLLFYFIDGQIGEFFNDLAFVVIATFFILFLETIIILPNKLFTSKAYSSKKNKIFISPTLDGVMKWIRDKTYTPSLLFALKYKLLTFVIAGVLLALSIASLQGGLIKKTFFPFIGYDNIVISLKMPEGTNQAVTKAWIDKIETTAWIVNEKYIGKTTDSLNIIQHISKTLGPSSSTAQLNIRLINEKIRAVSNSEISRAIAEATDPVIGAESLSFGESGVFGKAISVALLGNDPVELDMAKNELKSELQRLDVLKNVNDNAQLGIKEINVNLKPKAFLLGLDLQNILGQVRAGFFGKEVQRLQRGRDEVKIWVRFNKKERSSISDLNNMFIKTPSGARIPFDELASISIKRGLLSINRINGQQQISVEADLVNKSASISEILSFVESNIAPQILSKYPSVSISYEGQSLEEEKTRNSTAKVLPIIIFLIVGVIAFTLRSLSQTILLLVLIPFSLIGVVWGHFIHGYPISMLSIAAALTFVGVVVSNGIVLIGKFNTNLNEGMAFKNAVIDASVSRFRAVFLTSGSAAVLLTPLIFENSPQVNFLIPIAITVVYGIISVGIIILILLPILLVALNNLKRLFLKIWEGRSLSPEEVENDILVLKIEHDEH